MAIPSTPTSFAVQEASGQVYLSWDITATATSYSVQRSIDGVNFTTLASPSLNEYLDTTVTIGSMYYYQVAATNGSGTSPYTAAQSIVPAPTSEMSLGQLRLAAQQRADRVNSNFVTKTEWNSYINQAMYELYDLLIDAYEDYYIAPPITFQTDGSSFLYALPNGTNYTSAPSFYKLSGVDLAVNQANNAWVTINKFNFIDRNRFVFPNTASTIYGVFNLTYRLMGSNIMFTPVPSSGQTVRLWYIPRLQELLKDRDLTTIGVSGWLEYVIVRAALLALTKEESDTSALSAQLQWLKSRIEESSVNRDAGQPDTISDTRQGSFGNWGNTGFGGPSGGF